MTKKIMLRIGQWITCGQCGGERLFGYGPCRGCGHVPSKEAVDRIRRDGVWVDESGKVQAKPTVG